MTGSREISGNDRKPGNIRKYPEAGKAMEKVKLFKTDFIWKEEIFLKRLPS